MPIATVDYKLARERVECPRCAAKPGSDCLTPTGKPQLVHRDRVLLLYRRLPGARAAAQEQSRP